MFELIGRLNQESRIALFQSVLDPASTVSGTVNTRAVAAGLLKTREIHEFMRAQAVDLEELAKDLDASGTDVPTDEQLFEQVASRLPPSGGFMSLPISALLREAIDRLTAETNSAPEESITPTRLLLALIENDRSLAEVMMRSGVTADLLRLYLK